MNAPHLLLLCLLPLLLVAGMPKEEKSKFMKYFFLELTVFEFDSFSR